MLERKDVELLSIEHESHAGMQAVRAVFQWNSPSGNQFRITCVLDPQIHWRVLETTWDKNGSREVRTVEYFNAPGECLPSRITETRTATDEIVEEYKKTIVIAELPTRCTVALDRFTLAAYGLQKAVEGP